MAQTITPASHSSLPEDSMSGHWTPPLEPCCRLLNRISSSTSESVRTKMTWWLKPSKTWKQTPCPCRVKSGPEAEAWSHSGAASMSPRMQTSDVTLWPPIMMQPPQDTWVSGKHWNWSLTATGGLAFHSMSQHMWRAVMHATRQRPSCPTQWAHLCLIKSQTEDGRSSLQTWSENSLTPKATMPSSLLLTGSRSGSMQCQLRLTLTLWESPTCSGTTSGEIMAYQRKSSVIGYSLHLRVQWCTRKTLGNEACPLNSLPPPDRWPDRASKPRDWAVSLLVCQPLPRQLVWMAPIRWVLLQQPHPHSDMPHPLRIGLRTTPPSRHRATLQDKSGGSQWFCHMHGCSPRRSQGSIRVCSTRYGTLWRPALTYLVGDKVWLSSKNIVTDQPTAKLADKWLGPYPITSIISHSAVWLQLPKMMKIHPVFNVTMICPHQPDSLPNHQPAPPPPPVITGPPEEGEWEVEHINDTWRCYRKLQYLVKWKGWSNADWTWEPP